MRRRVLVMAGLGFSAGLPLLLVFGTLSVRLREAGLDRAAIGFISWAGLAYGLKVLWAPLVDSAPVPLLSWWLGRRRGWILLAQAGVAACLAAMAFVDAARSPLWLALLAVALAFCGATQDIAVDAWRIEVAPPGMQGVMAAAYMAGYRAGMILAGAVALEIAGLLSPADGYSHAAWRVAWLAMAAAAAIAMVVTLLAPAPPTRPARPARGHGALARLRMAAVAPFLEFWSRFGAAALLLLALAAVYRLSDVTMGVMANVFYVDMGFTKAEIARASKLFGIVMTLLGALLGGLLVTRHGALRVLFAGGVLAAATNLGFALMAWTGADSVWALALAVAADSLAAGVATAAFVAWLSGLAGGAHTATQYALLTSVMALAPKFLAGFSGVVAEAWGWPAFFLLTAALGAPALGLVILAGRVRPRAPMDGSGRT